MNIPHNRKADTFLLVTAIVVLAVFAAVNLPLKRANSLQGIDLFISPHYAQLFGADTIDALIQEFEEQNPKLRLRPADDSVPPDIVFFEEGELGDLVRQGALLSLGADQWAIPLVSFMDLLCYNIDLLQSAGFDRPPKNRVEFLACARVAAQPGMYGAALGLSPADPLAMRREIYSWIWAAGGEIRPPEDQGREPALPRTAADVIAFFRQLEREGLLAPGTFTRTGAQRLEEFAEGKIAMLTVSARYLPLLQQRMSAASFGVTVIPAAVVQGKTYMGLSSLYAGISGECSTPDDARAFLAFLAEKGPALAAALRAVPGHFPYIFAGSYLIEDSLYSKAWEIFEASEITDYFPGHPAEMELERFIRQKLME